MTNTQPYPMNREQRRAHYKENKNNPGAIYCPRCKHKTRHMAMPEKPYTPKEGLGALEGALVPCSIVCVACGNALRCGITGLKPYEYVKEGV